MRRFTKENYHSLCDQLGKRDKVLQTILNEWGYPPFWVRPNTYETLVLTILEQQVSLASAYAAYKKLKEKLGRITPRKVLQLSDEELRACYLSRQKVVYVRELAQALLSRRLDLKRFECEAEEIVRTELKAVKGIGDWTVDIYLLHALQRTDVFPMGDLALVNAIRMATGLPLTKEDMIQLADVWKPYRSIATMILWHFYIKKKKIRLLH